MTLKVGDVYFARIGGVLGKLIDFGQWVIDRREWQVAWGKRSPYSHVGIVVETTISGKAYVLEAMPRGARIRELYPELRRSDHKFVRLPLRDGQRELIYEWAPVFRGAKYGFSDYLALAVKHLGVKWEWLDRYIAGNERMICSQLVDQILLRVDYHVFDDGRLSQDVTPGDLWFALSKQGEVLR